MEMLALASEAKRPLTAHNTATAVPGSEENGYALALCRHSSEVAFTLLLVHARL